jgi:UPF0716 protein FxsA
VWLFLILLALPLAEIALFVVVGGWLGLWATLALVLLTTFIGVMILRLQELRAVMAMQTRGPNLQQAFKAGARRAVMAVGGILLFLPGFLTDTIGLLLLVPPVQLIIVSAIEKRFHLSESPGQSHAGPRQDGVIIDAEFIEVDPPVRSAGSRKSGWTQD